MFGSASSAFWIRRRGILAEHEVLSVRQREGLFVRTLHRRLHGRAQRRFHVIDHADQREHALARGTHADGGGAALRMRRGDDALLRSQPGE